MKIPSPPPPLDSHVDVVLMLICYTSERIHLFKFHNLSNNIYITSSEKFMRAQKWRKETKI